MCLPNDFFGVQRHNIIKFKNNVTRNDIVLNS